MKWKSKWKYLTEKKQIRTFGDIVRERTIGQLIAQHWLNNTENGNRIMPFSHMRAVQGSSVLSVFTITTLL